MSKVTFDGDNKIIQVDNNINEIFFETDVYSEWKEWSLLNLNFEQAILKLGGETLLPGKIFTPYVYILKNGWKIRPYDGQHILTINSNVFSDDGTNVYVLPITSNEIIVNVIIDQAGGLTSLQDQKLTQVSNQMLEIWRLLGLDPISQVNITKTSRTTTGIYQGFSVDGNGNVTITRI